MAAKTSGKRGRAVDHPAVDHDEHEHVEFRLSKKTASAIDAALKGLTEPQQQRVLEAVDRVGEEAGEKVGRWVEENVVANANELLALLAPDLAARGRWDDLRAIFNFLEHLDVPVDHARLGRTVKKSQGDTVARAYTREMQPTTAPGKKAARKR